MFNCKNCYLKVTEICFGDDMKALYPAVGLQSVTDETSVFIADLSSSKLWQDKNTLHQTVRAQAGVDSQLAADTPVIRNTFSLVKSFEFCFTVHYHAKRVVVHARTVDANYQHCYPFQLRLPSILLSVIRETHYT